MKDNLISVEFTPEEMKKIDEALNVIIGVLEPKAVNLTPEERRQYGTVADYNKMFIEKVKANMEQTPTTTPPTVDKAEFDRDYRLSAQMSEPLRKIARVQEMLTDTRMLADFDNYVMALSYYKYMKFLASQNVAGTTAILSELKKHFKANGNRGKETPEMPDIPTENPSTPQP